MCKRERQPLAQEITETLLETGNNIQNNKGFALFLAGSWGLCLLWLAEIDPVLNGPRVCS